MIELEKGQGRARRGWAGQGRGMGQGRACVGWRGRVGYGRVGGSFLLLELGTNLPQSQPPGVSLSIFLYVLSPEGDTRRVPGNHVLQVIFF